MPALGVAKRRLGARLDSAATAGEGTQNLLCAYLAAAVLAGLLANTLLGWWWLDPVWRWASPAWPYEKASKPGTARNAAEVRRQSRCAR